jgi:hypothetical protein
MPVVEFTVISVGILLLALWRFIPDAMPDARGWQRPFSGNYGCYRFFGSIGLRFVRRFVAELLAIFASAHHHSAPRSQVADHLQPRPLERVALKTKPIGVRFLPSHSRLRITEASAYQRFAEDCERPSSSTKSSANARWRD